MATVPPFQIPPEGPPPEGKPRLLLVEDAADSRKIYQRILSDTYTLTVAKDGLQATTILQHESFDIILSDILLPGVTGVELLRLIRTYDLDVPVLLMTGAPDLEGAIHAVDHGAIGYLVKPFSLEELRTRLAKGLALSRLAKAKRTALELQPPVPITQLHGINDRAGLTSALETALKNLHLVYQPIVDLGTKRIVAYEALMRTGDGVLRNPGEILETAERIDQVRDVTMRVFQLAFDALMMLPESASLFINIHAHDLVINNFEQNILTPAARRIVLEVTERESIDAIPGLVDRISRLRRAGYRLAIDDLGAGYAGLTTFAAIEPEIVKIDMSLVRDIDSSIVRQRIVSSLVSLCRELDMLTVAEGIETISELVTIINLGCNYGQGYLLARPDDRFVTKFFQW